MSKTITFFTVGGLEEPSAIGRYIPLAKKLSQRGYKINYLALHPDFKSLKGRYLRQDGFDVYFVGQMHVLKRGSRKFYFNKLKLLAVVVTSTWRMITQGLRLKTDIIYCFKPQPINGLAAFVVKALKRKPLLLDCDDYEAELNRLSKFQKSIFVFFEDKLPWAVQRITFHSTFLKERYLKLGIPEDKFIQIYNGFNPDRFNNPDQQKVRALKESLHLTDKRTILYLGSLSLCSGHAIDLLIKAFVHIKKEIPNAVLLIVGGGEDFDKLQAMVSPGEQDAIIFAGKIPSEEIPCYIQLAEASVDPVYESLTNKARCPIKLFESMVLGVPVVTSDIGDRRKILGDGKAGLLVRIGDEEDLARGIVTALTDRERVHTMKEEMSRIIHQYSWDNMTEVLLEQIPEL